MSSRAVCTACRKPMSAGAVRCVYCGAFRGKTSVDAAEPTKTAPNYREAAGRAPEPPAPIAKREAPKPVRPAPTEPEPEVGILAGLFLPHPKARGLMRGIEWMVIALQLPLLCASLLGLGIALARMQWAAMTRGRVLDENLSASWLRILALLSGFAVLIGALSRSRDLTLTHVGIVLGSQVAVLVVRLALRSAVSARPAPATR